MMCTDSLWSVKRETGGYGVTITVSYVARAMCSGRCQIQYRTTLSIAAIGIMLLPVGVVAISSAQDRDRDQLRKDELLLDKHILQT